jgi:hypothetical protein
MKALVYYIDHHWDNYQGGSGKTFEGRLVVELAASVNVYHLKEYIRNAVSEHIQKERPYKQDNAYSIQRIEIL